MLTVADGIIRAIVLIAVFIGLFFLMLSGFQESRRLGAKKHHRSGTPAGADLGHVRCRLRVSFPRSGRQRFSKLQVILFCQGSYQRIPAKKQSMQSLGKDFRVEERPPSTHLGLS
jgi:hypothetical protein